MKIRIIISLFGVACLSGFVTTVLNTPSQVSQSPSGPPASQIPEEVAALAGVWEGLGPADLPVRLVVEEIRGRWATVLYTWGDQPDGTFHRGWERVRALVFPGGKLFWRHPGDFTFQLSEDWTTLVGKREQGGRTATSLMRRVPEGTAVNAVHAGTDG